MQNVGLFLYAVIPDKVPGYVEPKEALGAAAIGFVAILFITCELAVVVLMDVEHLERDGRMFKDNIVAGFRRVLP